ncbi:Myosin-13 [Dirofilaria immitis]
MTVKRLMDCYRGLGSRINLDLTSFELLLKFFTVAQSVKRAKLSHSAMNKLKTAQRDKIVLFLFHDVNRRSCYPYDLKTIQDAYGFLMDTGMIH